MAPVSPPPLPSRDIGARLVFAALLVAVAGPSLLLLSLLGTLGIPMFIGGTLSSASELERMAAGEPLVGLLSILALASGLASIALLAVHATRYLRRGRLALAGRRREIWRLHAFAAPALVFCVLFASARLAAQGFRTDEMVFALVVSGLPVLVPSLFLLWTSTPAAEAPAGMARLPGDAGSG